MSVLSLNSARTSSALSPLRSVRAPPSSDQPPPRPGCGYTGTPAADKAFEIAARGRDRHLEFLGQFGCGDPFVSLEDQGCREAIGAHDAIASRKVGSSRKLVELGTELIAQIMAAGRHGGE